MKYLLLALLLFCCFGAYAQNLVPNPSFEDTVGCPYEQDQVYLSKGWSSFGQSSDYFNSCDNLGGYGVPENDLGYQKAATGNAYCGIFCIGPLKNYREFVGRQLAIDLIPGNKYYVSIKVSLAENSNCASNNIGVAFSSIPFDENMSAIINNHASIYSNAIITDTANWVIVSGSFISDSAYKYIIIGNFFQDDLTNKIIYSGNLCNAYYYVDDICVSTDSLSCDLNYNGINQLSPNRELTIYPNPSKDELYLTNSFDNITCTFFNLFGQTIKIFTNQTVYDVSEIADGIYLVEINYNNSTFFKKQIIIH